METAGSQSPPRPASVAAPGTVGKSLNSSPNPRGGRGVPESRESWAAGGPSHWAPRAPLSLAGAKLPPAPGVSSTQLTSIYLGHQGLLLVSFVTVPV